jgi:hypothetical protein
MARGRGNQKSGPGAPAGAPSGAAEPGGARNALPELMRRALSVGFSGFFLTESAVRRALGDTLPRDWVDFAVEQSERTRAEFLERLSHELARSLEHMDLGAALAGLLEGRTLEIQAQIRLGPKRPGRARTRLRLADAPRKGGG